MIRLRGHHLICLHFFGGEGYSEEFRESLRALVKEAEGGQEIEAASGADDVCRKCPYLSGDKCAYEEGADEEVRAMDRKALELLGIRPGESLRWAETRQRLPSAFRQWARSYCESCAWREACLKSPLWRALTSKD